jgi:tetratricopeptide (TPR) repeat protein
MAAEEHSTTRVGRWLLAVVVPSSALALGSLLTIPLIVCALGAAVACALLWWHPPKRTPRRTAPLVLVAAAVLLGATILQAIPLPAGLVAAIAPRNADLWSRALTPLKEAGPAWHTISLAPAATRENILRGLFYLAVFLGALRVSTQENGATFLERLAVASALIVGFAAFLHPAMGAQRVFGLYQPRDVYSYIPGRYGPLLNVNHLAAYMNIGACVALGAALARRQSMPRPISVSAVCVLAALSVWAASRGGLGSLVVGLAVTGLVGAYARHSRGRIDPRRAGAALVILMAIAAAGLFALGISEEAREEIANKDLDKLQLPLRALRLVPLAPFFGVGRGAFESVFPLVRGGTLYVTFTHPENFVAQWLTEWGIPFSLLGGGLLALAFRPKSVLLAPHPAAGAWAALVAALLHDVVDFHLEVPGVMALLAVCAALVVGGHSAGSSTRSDTRGQRALRPSAFAAALGVVVVTPIAASGIGHDLATERDRLRVLAIDATTPREAFRAEVRGAMLRYPAESYFPLIGGVYAQLTRSESVIPWVGRALECNPGFGRAHMVLARSLASRFPAQARLEYRLAYRNDLNLREAMMKEAPALVGDFDSAMDLVVDGAEGVPMLDALAAGLAWRLPATSARLDAELLRRSPSAPGPRRRAIEAAVLDAKLGMPWCVPSPAPCLDHAARSADELLKVAPEDCGARALEARVKIARGQAGPALDAFAAFADRSSDRRECLKQLVELATEADQPRHIDLALDRAVRAGCTSTADCAEMYAWAGGIEEGRGRSARAIQLYRKAIDAAPERDDLLLRVGDLGTQTGLLREADEAYSALARRHPDNAQYAAQAAEVRATIQRRLHER